MAFPGVRPQPEMTDSIRGAFGLFTSVGPRQISFINTRFATNRLGLLKTARQVIPREQMTIRELMQRDIDDERVRTEIVTYLNPPEGIDSPRFFPPIVVAVLVRDQTTPGRFVERYPTPITDPDGRFPRPKSEEEGVFYEEKYYGDAFGVRIPLAKANDDLSEKALFHGADFRWNRDRVHLVAIDGQHRLLALQALLGHLDEEDLVRGYEEIALAPHELEKLGLAHVPVCLVFAPMIHDGNAELNDNDALLPVFKQLFVDINKNAKIVSESRNILLNERDAIAVFTRNIIDSFIVESKLPKTKPVSVGDLPLYTFEFESPEKKEWQINDLRAVCSVGILNSLIRDTLLRESDDTDSFRTALEIEDGDPELDPELTKRVGVPLYQITHEVFSHWQRAVLEDRFRAQSDTALGMLLRQIYPARQLVDSLEAKRISLLRDRQSEGLNSVHRHSYDYLLGTVGDQRQIELIAKKDVKRVGSYDPECCRQAIHLIRDKYLRHEISSLRAEPFARIFFSHVGQKQIVHLVLRTLADNASTAEAKAPRLVSAWVEDFNKSFEGQRRREDLFDRDQAWNRLTVATLGTQQYKQRHIAGLLNLSLWFLPATGQLYRLFGSSDRWDQIRDHLAGKGRLSVQSVLQQRLRAQLVQTSEYRMIADENERSQQVAKQSLKQAKVIIAELDKFMEENRHRTQST